MKFMVFSGLYYRFAIEKKFLDRIIETAKAAVPNETAGIMAGMHMVGGTYAIVTGMRSYVETASRCHSTLDLEKMSLWLDAVWKTSGGKEFYLGDWHTHPGGEPVPSEEDDNTFNNVIKAGECDEVISLIIGREFVLKDIEVYVYRADNERIHLDDVSYVD